MAVQNDFFTWQSLATFAGTTTATTAVTNGICRVFPSIRHTAPLGLVLALLFCILLAVIDPTTGGIVFDRPFATYFIAVVNGFFVFASAAGLSAGGAAVTRGAARRQVTARGGTIATADALPEPEKTFFRHWL
ncbi:hypothetical protein [Bradyrhizobium sp. CCBAU 45384]|uniref:hypothetical protein n=1 Tax=Bradyrhizobium sp. CCBAU 45384 TaxID=858428 RepID=UPI0023061C3E|nr:hypothetical protein [Bradyrhizobium sp. CCBAU 45384]MDA9409455.1 hypothetical protein [Bradyrhizobium sp. CCBAU 45384]